MAETVVPQRIRRFDDAVELTWTPSHVGRFDARRLRLACPCAACVDEMTGRPLLDPRTVPVDVRPERIDLVGAYAIRIRWSDGHGTGMLTYDWLLANCPCEACQSGRPPHGGAHG